MNTTKKGDKLEDRVFLILKDLLSNDDFFVNEKNSRIYKRKGYYSKEREADIITDISIETYMPGAENYSMLTIIECKNLNHKVPVDDIEEFESKLRQIGEHNTKGIVFTRLGFQKSALKVGKSRKLGLCIVEDKDKLQWISYRKNKLNGFTSSHVTERLMGEARSGLNFCAFHNNKTYECIPDLLIDFGVIDYYSQKAKYVNVDFLTEGEISTVISNLIDSQCFYNGSLDMIKMCRYLTEKHMIDFDFDKRLGDSVLGKVIYKDKKIVIDKDLISNKTKWRFTLAHEIGHLILHEKYSNELEVLSDHEIDVNELSDPSLNKRMEIQANVFASQLLMPLKPLLSLTQEFFKKERINKGYLYLDYQSCNQHIVMKFLNQLQVYFEVSKSVAKYRLIGLKLLQDESNNSIGNIMRRIPNG